MPGTPQPITVRHEGGARFAIRTRGHTIHVDQPESGGGEDSAPMPLELIGAALGSCVALYVSKFCTGRGLSTEGMSVEVEQQTVRDPYRIGRFRVRVVPPAGLPPRLVELLERVATHCPAHYTLGMGAEVDIRIDAPEPMLI